MYQGWRNSLARRSWRVRFPSGPQNRRSCHRHINLFHKFRRWCIHTDLSAYESVGGAQKWKPHPGLSWSANRFFLLGWRSAGHKARWEDYPRNTWFDSKICYKITKCPGCWSIGGMMLLNKLEPCNRKRATQQARLCGITTFLWYHIGVSIAAIQCRNRGSNPLTIANWVGR